MNSRRLVSSMGSSSRSGDGPYGQSTTHLACRGPGRQVHGADLNWSESGFVQLKAPAQLRCNPNLAILKDGISVARPLSVSVYAPLSRLCPMNPRMVMDCIALWMMPTEPWSMPVATQNKITRSCALSFVVDFSMAYSRLQLLANAAIVASRVGSQPCVGLRSS